MKIATLEELQGEAEKVVGIGGHGFRVRRLMPDELLEAVDGLPIQPDPDEKRKARKPTAAEMKAELRSRERLVVLGLVEPKLTLEQVYLLGQVRVAALAQEIMELSDMNRPFARGSGGSTS